MKKLLLMTALLSAMLTNAQIAFSEIATEQMLQGVSRSSVAYADIDGDNDQDVLISGYTGSTVITKLYKNNGYGVFVEVAGTTFIGLYGGSSAFADIDGDGDQDFIITGKDSSFSNAFSKLYTNDGTGAFTEVIGITIENVSESTTTFSDVDGDNDQDLLLTGWTGTTRISKLYINDGLGNFTEVLGTPFVGVSGGSAEFADVDGDNDQDVLITGFEGAIGISNLYKNNGTGIYSLVSGTSFDGVFDGSIAFSDVDGDTDQDVIITGRNGSNTLSKLYSNDGLGNFTEVSGTPFIGVHRGAVAFADIDGDTDQDLLITGYDSAGGSRSSRLINSRIAKLYTNNGSGIFTEVTNTTIEPVRYSTVSFLDINGNGDKDLILTGEDLSFANITNVYVNDGNGVFTENIDTSNIINVAFSKNVFADIDGDGDQDLLIAGYDGTNRITKLYDNNGSGEFTENTLTTFDGFSSLSMAFADIDGDTDMDLLISGQTSGNTISKLYTNDGIGKFTEVMGTSFMGVYNGSVAFEDIDGDSDLDVLIIGSGDSNLEAKLYKNDGNGNFTEVVGTPFVGVDYASINFADIDGDTDKDIIVTGRDISFVSTTKLYTNDGLGSFTEVSATGLENIFGKSVFADVDGDNDQDLLISGIDASSAYVTKLYSNNGSGLFTEITSTPFIGFAYNDVVFSDVDNDADLDVMIVGNDGSSNSAKLYSNDGTGVFSEVASMPFLGVDNGSVAIADFDGDNFKDVIISGSSFGIPITTRYKNYSTGTLSVAEFTPQDDNIVLYPNPNLGFFQIKSNSTLINVEIYSIQGQSIKSFTPQNQYDISDLSSGIYFVKIQANYSEITKRIIKQ